MAMAPSMTWTNSRLQAGVDRLCRSDLDGRELLKALADRVRVAIPHQGMLLLRTDPTTALPTDGVVEAIPPALCKPFWDNELLEDDFNKFVDLGRTAPVAATLLEATDGDLLRSRRYRTLYQALGVTDELRTTFTARDGSCWGLAQLIRTDGAFGSAEKDLLASVAPAVAAALRARFALGAPAVSRRSGPALVILDKSGEIESITAEARRWLAELTDGSSTGMTPIPEPVYLVAGRARAAREDRPSGPACAQVRTVRHGWLHLHASCLDGPNGPDRPVGSVAVVMTPAQAPDLMPLLALGYRLTDREQEVLRFLARGMSTADMSQQLEITTHTVRDHIKSLFGKVGVRSRAELLARIFAEHYFDRLEADVDRTEQ